MDSTVSFADDLDAVCPACIRCFADHPQQCPGCGHDRPEEGWNDLGASDHEYLGAIIGERYRLEQFLGSGSAGSVYRARDLRLQRPFAVKILEAAAEDGRRDLERVRRQFENEVEALSRIRNPHVVNIHEALTLDGGIPAMLTEFIDGATLQELLDDRDRLAPDASLLLIQQIANGLHEAHCRRVIHRDVKPANVIVERLPASGLFARILDFGLVHLVEQSPQPGSFQGTPLYAAPEQCRGNREVTPQTDIYSLGCVLYHLIAGRPPFDHADARTILFSHVDREPERLGDAAPVSVPGPVDDLVARMLEKDPADRPDDLSEVVETLDEVRMTSEQGPSVPFVESEVGLGPTTSDLAAREGGAGGEDSEANVFRAEQEDTERLEQLVQFVELEGTFPGFEGPVEACSVEALGNCAALSDAAGAVHVLSVPGEGFAESYPAADEPVGALTVRSRSGLLVGAGASGGLFEWAFADSEVDPDRISALEEPATALDVAPQSRKLYLGGDGGAIRAYDRRLDRCRTLCELDASVSHLRVIEGGERVVAATLDGRIVVGDDLEGEATFRTEADVGREPRALAYSAESGAVLVGDDAGRLYSYCVGNSEGLEVVETSRTDLRGLAVTPERIVLGFGVRGSVAQTWRIRHEWLEERLQWLHDGDASVEQTFESEVIEAAGGRDEQN